jgi:hypothetical protein
VNNSEIPNGKAISIDQTMQRKKRFIGIYIARARAAGHAKYDCGKYSPD